MKRICYAVVFAALSNPALAASYAVVCSAPCTAQDGSTQPIGTVVNRIVWNGLAPWTPPPNTVVVADTGQVVYSPGTAGTSTSGWVLWNRFTPAEQAALIAKGAAFTATALTLAGEPSLNTDDPVIVANFTSLVTANVLTPARATRILNLAVSSP
jgi:hypothetical protein